MHPPPHCKRTVHSVFFACLLSTSQDSENPVVPRLWFPSWKRPGEVLPAKIAVLVSLVNIYGVASHETEGPALKNLTMSGTRLTQETIKCSVVCGTDQQDNGTSELGQFQQREGLGSQNPGFNQPSLLTVGHLHIILSKTSDPGFG